MAGLDVVCSLEIDQWASDTLRVNHPNMLIIQDDICNYQSSGDIQQICPYFPDIIIGGPPCQGFSIAGPAQKDPKDPRNSLFVDFARWVQYLHPKIFVMENVKGLLSRRNANGEPVIQIIKRTFEELDYNVEIWLLNAVSYGVPQTRERIFVVGNRLGIQNFSSPIPTHTLSFSSKQDSQQLPLFEHGSELSQTITLWDAISDLPELEAGQGVEEQSYKKAPLTKYQLWARGKQEILFNHAAMNHSKRLVERFKHVNWGESSADVPAEHMPRTRNGDGKISKTAENHIHSKTFSSFPQIIKR